MVPSLVGFLAGETFVTVFASKVTFRYLKSAWFAHLVPLDLDFLADLGIFPCARRLGEAPARPASSPREVLTN